MFYKNRDAGEILLRRQLADILTALDTLLEPMAEFSDAAVQQYYLRGYQDALRVVAQATGIDWTERPRIEIVIPDRERPPRICGAERGGDTGFGPGLHRQLE